MLSVMTIAKESSSKESSMGLSTEHQYSAISKHSLIQDVQNFTEGLRTSYQPGSHVNHLVTPGKKRVGAIKETPGRKLPSASKLYDQDSACWKTCQLYLPMDILQQSFLTWPRSGMTSGMMFYPLPPLVPTTYGRGCGLLPTPVASDWKRQGVTLDTAKRYVDNGRGAPLPLKITLLTGLTGIPNPLFYESIMGWPLGWTELKPLGTDNIRLWLKRHGKG